MKKLLTTFILALPLLSFGQYQYGFLQELYFGRQPSARAEALGKGYSAIDGDLASIFYNPAGTASLKGAEINTSFASPFYSYENAEHSFISAGFNINKYLTVGISRNHFSFGEEIGVINTTGNSNGETHIPKSSIYTLNLSSQPINNLFLGLNTNVLNWNPVDQSARTTYFDFGAIKKFDLRQQKATNHALSLAASITNLNFAEISLEYNGNETKNDLPVITRYGLNYQFHLNQQWLFDTLKTFSLMLHGEYQLLLNSDYHNGFHTGVEMMFFEILAARIGYYQESQNDYNFPAANKSEISDITYGFGLQLPLHKLTKLPLNLNFDYASLPQVSYTTQANSWENFSTYTLRLNWVMK